MGISVYFFGDSICFGQGVSIHKGWVPRISARLEQLGKEFGREVTVINTSINGNTTRMALERMPYDIQSHAPDIMILQFGMNDCNYWETDRGLPRVSLKAFSANLEEIIARAFNFNVKHIIVNTNHPTLRNANTIPNTNTTYQKSNELYNEEIRRTVTNLNDDRVVLNDMEKAFTGKLQHGNKLEKLLLSDCLHLSEAGHDLYFDAIVPKIENIVTNYLKRM